MVGDKWPADLGLGAGGDDVAGQLVVALGLYVATVVLVEVAYLVHQIDWGSHVLVQSDGHIANIAGVALGLAQGVVVLDELLLDRVHDQEKGDGEGDENYAHHYIEDNSFLEGRLPKLAVDEQQVDEFVPACLASD